MASSTGRQFTDEELQELQDHAEDVWLTDYGKHIGPLVAEVKQSREIIEYFREREAHFAKILGVADGGHYRNDWDGAIQRFKDALWFYANPKRYRSLGDYDPDILDDAGDKARDALRQNTIKQKEKHMKTYTPETIEKDVQKAREDLSLAGGTVKTLQTLAEQGYNTEEELTQAADDLRQAVFSYNHLLQVRYELDKKWAIQKLSLIGLSGTT